MKFIKEKTNRYLRLQGHRKIPRQRECYCGKPMYINKNFSGGWACETELELAKRSKTK